METLSSADIQQETVQPETQNSLREILFELRGQKSQINSLKDEVRGQSLAVDEVKKLKTTKEIPRKFSGNRLQFEFNSELEDSVKQILWAIGNVKIDYAKEMLAGIADKLHVRNKHIRIADTSEGGWETVRQYQSNPLASDSDDESRILKADSRAVRKRKQQKPKTKAKSPAVALGYTDSMALARRFAGTSSTSQAQSGGGHSFRGYQGFPSNRGQLGPCFGCGEYNHVRRTCPYTRFGGAQQGQQQTEQPGKK
ncbi:uncharacterized protein LOC128241392 [Mya arenaria]|uniref:uncharacterized protein LOC128241392 n=1 Tax=Mya arenaria TaxID=6604 RepID=UPI0022E779E8|nr:uncharacterized protein LOC128241392 [Mya arenaria]